MVYLFSHHSLSKIKFHCFLKVHVVMEALHCCFKANIEGEALFDALRAIFVVYKRERGDLCRNDPSKKKTSPVPNRKRCKYRL